MAAETDHSGDCEIESAEEEETRRDITKQLMRYPDVLAALQSQRNAEMLAALPQTVKRRIKALKNLQFQAINIEAKFFKEVHDLECKYQAFYAPLQDKRQQIVSGAHEPTDEESQWASDEEDEEISKELKDKAKIEDENKQTVEPVEDQPVKGVPDFWLTIFRNVSLLSDMVQDHDEPILKHLTDIKVKYVEEPMGFVLEFIFDPNEHFTNTVLTKEYDMKCNPEEDDPFGFEGCEIYRCRGCTINWNKGKNVTVKTVKKKQKHKSRGLVRTITKTVQADSFFNFFSPPSIPDDINGADVDDDVRNVLTSDFEIGHYIRERVVPRAVLFFTGEGIEDEDYDEEEEDEDEDEEDDAEEEEEGSKDKCRKDQNCKQQ